MMVGAEGSPLLLAERRTLSFADRKIVLGSTPLEEETSQVLRAYGRSDQRIFEVPCPECGERTEIKWQNIEWEADKPETAAFRCPPCQGLIEERFKAEMVGRGVWRITQPMVAGHAGFRINALVSLLANASWGKLAAEFLRAKHAVFPDILHVGCRIGCWMRGKITKRAVDALEDGIRGIPNCAALACEPGVATSTTCSSSAPAASSAGTPSGDTDRLGLRSKHAEKRVAFSVSWPREGMLQLVKSARQSLMQPRVS